MSASVFSKFTAYAVASYRVLAFYFYYVVRFGRIHRNLDCGKLFGEIDALPVGKSLSIKVNTALKLNIMPRTQSCAAICALCSPLQNQKDLNRSLSHHSL